MTKIHSRPVMSSTLRCLQVLELLAQEPNSFSFGDIAAALGIDKTSAHRFIRTLIAAGFVECNPQSRRYHLAGKALWVGTGHLRYSPVYRAAYGELEDLAHSAENMVHLGVWDNDTVLYLHTVGPPRTVLLFTDLGQRRPVHSTALGKALLAYRPTEDLERVLASNSQRYTDRTITSVEAMREELVRIRQQDYSLDDEEGIPGLRCVAAVIRDSRGEVAGALSVSGSLAQLTDEYIPRYARLVQEAALRASSHLGYRDYAPYLMSALGR